MYTWFYAPSRLPKTYNKWISTAAQIDPNLVEILRRAHTHEMIYGKDTGQAHLLVPLCKELNLPIHWADPKITIPIPCELYHSGTGPSCEYHALSRFVKSFVFAAKLYLPLNLLPRLLASSTNTTTTTPTIKTLRSLIPLVKSALRSSSFLATFIATFYYAVCLARTRLGPNLIPLRLVSRQMWDSGLCVLAGCVACGWSVLVETPAKRQELAFFVAPRALGTWLPRVYDRRYVDRERVVFALSVAVVLGAVADKDARRVRGVLGKGLRSVLAE